jgi:hypothetical protein
MNGAPALAKDTTGLRLTGATEAVVDHEGWGKGAPGVGCVTAERPDQGQQKSFKWRKGGERGGEEGSVAP